MDPTDRAIKGFYCINVEYFISNCVVLRSKYSYRLLLEIIRLKSHNVLKFCDSDNVINFTYLGLSPIVKKKKETIVIGYRGFISK